MRQCRSSATENTVLAIVAVLLLSLTAAGQANTEKVLHSFGAGSDGLYPFANVIFDANEVNLYGTTWEGGSGPCNGGCGTVFEMMPGAHGEWTESVIYNFQGRPTDAGKPSDSLIFDASGNLYGTTRYGGPTSCPKACGTVFELSPGSNGTWTETILHNFTGGKDGENPYAELIWDKAGNLYSNTYGGGAHGKGTVFEMSPSGSGWTKTVLYSFAGSDGNGPLAGLVFDSQGNLYGTTGRGGSADKGVVFELSPTGQGAWKQTVIHSFAGGTTDGAEPSADLIFDSAGNLYSTARNGGSGNCKNGCGIVFELSPSSGGPWTETILHNFSGNPDGTNPFGGLIFDKSGNLWGTTQSGGSKNDGVIFELTLANGTWTESIAHEFRGWPKDGAKSYANLILNSKGNFFGTTIFGGANDPGVVFEYIP
jgi:uncharacterized repeat protein (TIGR03803 family)